MASSSIPLHATSLFFLLLASTLNIVGFAGPWFTYTLTMRRLGELPDSLPVELHPAAAAVRNLQQSGGSGGSSLSPFSLIGAITTGCNGFFVTLCV